MGINKFKIKLDNKIYISILIMSGNANKNPQEKKPVDKKVSSTSISEDSMSGDSISGTPIIKPTKENYYEVNTKNEKIIRNKYLKLEKQYTELQSEIQTFNMHYKQLLELNQIHKKPYFLPSIGLMEQRNEGMERSQSVSLPKGHIYPYQIGGSPEPEPEQEPEPELRPDSGPGSGPDPEPRSGSGPGAESRPGSGSGPDILSWDQPSSPAPLPGEEVPQYFSCLKCCSDECNEENRLMAIFQFDNENKLVDTKLKKFFESGGREGDGGDILQISSSFYLAHLASNPQADRTPEHAPHMVAPRTGNFKCMCKNHNKNLPSSCGNRPLIEKTNGYTYEFKPYKSNIDSENVVNMVFFCFGCNKFFRYECLRTINEDNSVSDSSGCMNQTNPFFNTRDIEEIKRTLPSINKNILFRKPLFKKDYGDNLEKTARGLEIGLSMTSKPGDILPSLKLHGGLGYLYTEMNNIGIPLALGVGAGVVGAGVVGSGVAAGVGVGINTVAETRVQSGGAGQDIEDHIDAYVSATNTAIGGMAEGCKINIEQINDLTRRVEKNISRGKADIRELPITPGPHDVSDPQARFPDISNQNKLLSNSVVPDTNQLLTYGTRYKDFKITKTYEGFISESKKWKICENEESMMTEFDSIKEPEGQIMSEADLKKYRPQYKQLQGSYISEFNQGVRSYQDYPFSSVDFNYLINLKSIYDKSDSTDIYTSVQLELNENKSIHELGILVIQPKLGISRESLQSLINTLDSKTNIDVNSEEMIRILFTLLGLQNLDQVSMENLELNLQQSARNYGKIERYSRGWGGVGGVYFTPKLSYIKNKLLSNGVDQGFKTYFHITLDTKDEYEYLQRVTLNYLKLKKLKAELKSKYDPLKKKIDENVVSSKEGKSLSVGSNLYKGLLTKMCGRKAASLWYGEDNTLTEDEYKNIRSLFSRLGLLYLPYFDVSLVREFYKQGLYSDFKILSPDNLEGKITGSLNGEVKQISEMLNKLENLSVETTEYNQEILPLFDLLGQNQSKIQLLNDGRIFDGAYKITQLTGTNNILSGSKSLDFTGKSIWVEPHDSMGLKIVSPIQLLKIKKGLLEKAKKFYDIETSLKKDLEFKKQYEKELEGTAVVSDKEDEKTSGSKDKDESQAQAEEATGVSDKTGISEVSKEEQRDIESPEEKSLIKEEGEGEESKGEEIQTKSPDILYTEKDIAKQRGELDELKMEMKRKEEVLKNIASNIKLLKSQKHGEDSEQRQLYKMEYENKERDFILIQKLIEQREEKLKLMSQLIESSGHTFKKEKEEKLKMDEIERQKNLSLMHSGISSIAEKKSREMVGLSKSIYTNEITDLQNKLNDLEGDEIDIQHELVQNGGGRKRKDNLRGLLYKTESRKNKTKKKGRKARKNERKKDRSLRKRI